MSFRTIDRTAMIPWFGNARNLWKFVWELGSNWYIKTLGNY